MGSMFVTAGWVDLILVAVALEFAGLGLYTVRSRGVEFVWLLFLYLGSGAALLFALRASLGGSAPHWIALALALSLVTHLACLQQIFKALPASGRGEDGSLGPIRRATNGSPGRID